MCRGFWGVAGVAVTGNPFIPLPFCSFSSLVLACFSTSLSLLFSVSRVFVCDVSHSMCGRRGGCRRGKQNAHGQRFSRISAVQGAFRANSPSPSPGTPSPPAPPRPSSLVPSPPLLYEVPPFSLLPRPSSYGLSPSPLPPCLLRGAASWCRGRSTERETQRVKSFESVNEG